MQMEAWKQMTVERMRMNVNPEKRTKNFLENSKNIILDTMAQCHN